MMLRRAWPRPTRRSGESPVALAVRAAMEQAARGVPQLLHGNGVVPREDSDDAAHSALLHAGPSPYFGDAEGAARVTSADTGVGRMPSLTFVRAARAYEYISVTLPVCPG